MLNEEASPRPSPLGKGDRLRWMRLICRDRRPRLSVKGNIYRKIIIVAQIQLSKEHIIMYNLSRTVGDACPYGLCLNKTEDKRITISQLHVARRDISRRLCRLYHGIALRCLYHVRHSRSISWTHSVLYHAPQVHISLPMAKTLPSINLIHHSVVPLPQRGRSITHRRCVSFYIGALRRGVSIT